MSGPRRTRILRPFHRRGMEDEPPVARDDVLHELVAEWRSDEVHRHHPVPRLVDVVTGEVDGSLVYPLVLPLRL